MAETKDRENSFVIIINKWGSNNNIKRKILCHWNLIINNKNSLSDWIFFLLFASMGINRAELASSLASPVGQIHFIKSKRQIQNNIHKNEKLQIYKINRTKNKKFHSRILIVFCYFFVLFVIIFILFYFCMTSRDNDRKTPFSPTGVSSILSQSKNSQREIQRYFQVENWNKNWELKMGQGNPNGSVQSKRIIENKWFYVAC